MTRNEKVLKKAKEWADNIGRQKAIKRLFNTDDIAFSTASKICGGSYESTPKDSTVRLLLAEMARDGFTVEEE